MAILEQGQKYMGGTVQYDAATGKRLGNKEITVENKDLTATGQYPDMAKFNIPQNSAITTAALTPAQPLTPVIPPKTTSTTAPLVETPQTDTGAYTPLAQESSIYKMLQDWQTGTNQLGSQEAFQQQQEAKYGVQEKQGLVTSLKNQYDSLARQAEQVRLQAQQDVQNQQAAAQAGGANVTKGGLAPEQRAMQTRANQQLLSLSIQQNNIASQHALASGDLATALSLADRAVKMEYQPKKDALDAQRANIELLLKDPTLTLAQQKRADEAKAANEKAQKQLEIDQKNKETIQGLAMQAQQNGAPAAIVTAILNAPDFSGALTAGTGWTSKETATSIQEYNFAVRGGYKGSFSDYQNEDANRKIAVAKAGVAKTATGLPTNIATQVDKLSSSFDSSPIVKNYNEVQNKKLSVDSILQTGIKGPADLALVYEFMKALDPTSVVRETEYSTAAASGNIFSGMYAKYNGYLTEGGGFLPEQVKKDFQTIIDKKFNVATSQYDNLRKETARKINLKTGSEDGVDYLTDYGAAVPSAQGGQTSEFDQYTNDINPVGADQATIPRSVWSKVQNKDALLQYVQSLGRKLLVTD